MFYSLSGGASVSSRLIPLVCVKWRVFSEQQLILTKFNRPGNFKGVTGFKKQTEFFFFCFEAGVPGFSAMPDHPIYHTYTQRLTCLRKGAQARQNHQGNEPRLPAQTLDKQFITQEGTIKHNEAHYLFAILNN